MAAHKNKAQMIIGYLWHNIGTYQICQYSFN